MAVTYGFYDSVGGDRKYNAEEFSRLFDGIIVDGVFHSVGDVFKVKPGTGLQVIVGTGRAWFDGTWTYNDADLPISLDSPDVLGRIDAVVIEVNRDILHRKNEIKIIKGTPSTKPIKPTLTNTDVLSQHALAYITVKSDATSIDVTDIEDVVGRSECPFVTGPLTTVDVDYLFSTWEGDFNEWFETVKDTLSGDVAGNLLNEINKVREESAYNTHCAIGDIITSNRKDFYPTLTNPNYLPCDGRILDEEAYPELTAELLGIVGLNRVELLPNIGNAYWNVWDSDSIYSFTNKGTNPRKWYLSKFSFSTKEVTVQEITQFSGRDWSVSKKAMIKKSDGFLLIFPMREYDTQAFSSVDGITWTSLGQVASDGFQHETFTSFMHSKDYQTLFLSWYETSSGTDYNYAKISLDGGRTWKGSNDFQTSNLSYQPTTNFFTLSDDTIIFNAGRYIRTFDPKKDELLPYDYSSGEKPEIGWVFPNDLILSKDGKQYSTDRGYTFTPTTGWEETQKTVIPTVEGKCWLVLENGRLLETSDGTSWTYVSTLTDNITYFNRGASFKAGGVVFGEDYAVYGSENYTLYSSGKKLANLPGFYVRCK